MSELNKLPALDEALIISTKSQVISNSKKILGRSGHAGLMGSWVTALNSLYEVYEKECLRKLEISRKYDIDTEVLAHEIANSIQESLDTISKMVYDALTKNFAQHPSTVTAMFNKYQEDSKTTQLKLQNQFIYEMRSQIQKNADIAHEKELNHKALSIAEESNTIATRANDISRGSRWLALVSTLISLGALITAFFSYYRPR